MSAASGDAKYLAVAGVVDLVAYLPLLPWVHSEGRSVPPDATQARKQRPHQAVNWNNRVLPPVEIFQRSIQCPIRPEASRDR